MKKNLFLLLLLFSTYIYSQRDFSDNWEDFYSYNNVKDFVKSGNKIYAIVDNAVFIYDVNTHTNKKISSVNGLSGETTSALFYDADFNRIVIGYTTGLLEIISQNGRITIHKEIEDLVGVSSKKINHISKKDNKLYLATDFSIVQYDIENLEFGDTYFIGAESTSVKINQTEIINDTIYAVTENGIYYANINNPFLIDFNNWTQPSGSFVGDFTAIKKFKNTLYVTKSNVLYKITNQNTLQSSNTFSNQIINLNATADFLTITTLSKAYIFNENMVQIAIANNTELFNFKLNSSFVIDDIIYLATTKFGILSKQLNDFEYEEIHPEGPLFNDIFSIEVLNNNLWVVYGAYNSSSYNITNTAKGFSHFNGSNWINTPFSVFQFLDLTDVSIDPNHENRVFISSNNNGLIEVVDDEIINKFTYNNSPLELSFVWSPTRTLVSGSVFDKQGNLWLTNTRTDHRIKLYDANNNWTIYDIEEAVIGGDKGLGEITIDNLGNKWLATRDFGAIVFNENGEQKKSLTVQTGKGKLPTNKVRVIIADRNNRMWIGTEKGLVVFSNAGGIFEAETYEANPILIQLIGGTGEEQAQPLLGIQPINTIAIDGADNKWFGTNSGVIGTNPSGRQELFNFTTDNSPLASNRVLKIRVDNTTGKVYFATTKGVVAFNNNVAPFGDTLGDTYAYPNPSTSRNEFVTIDGRHGTHLPRGTNVKIVDSAGYLVHETNVEEGVEIKGGKVIWDKTNLSGRKVASGIYIVLLTLPDKSETSITKIAIIK